MIDLTISTSSLLKIKFNNNSNEKGIFIQNVADGILQRNLAIRP